MQQRISHRQVRKLRPRRNRRVGWMDAEDWNMCLVSWWQDILEFWHLPEFVYGTMTYFTGPVYILVHILIITCLIILWDVEINPTADTWHVLYLYCHLTSLTSRETRNIPSINSGIKVKVYIIRHLPSTILGIREKRMQIFQWSAISTVDILNNI